MVKSFVKTTLTASQTPTNVFSGDANEFLPFDAHVMVRAVTSGATAYMTIFVDQDLILDNKIIPYVGSTLVDKDHVVVEFDAFAGSRLIIKLAEIGGSTPTVYTGMEAIPL